MKVKYVWRIVPNHNCFVDWGRAKDEIKYWFFKTRELGEAAVKDFVEKHHADYVKERIWYSKTSEGKEQLDKEEREWWQAKPPLNILRRKTKTVYLCGDPEWDSRDKRGAYYGELEQVKVLCG